MPSNIKKFASGVTHQHCKDRVFGTRRIFSSRKGQWLRPNYSQRLSWLLLRLKPPCNKLGNTCLQSSRKRSYGHEWRIWNVCLRCDRSNIGRRIRSIRFCHERCTVGCFWWIQGRRRGLRWTIAGSILVSKECFNAILGHEIEMLSVPEAAQPAVLNSQPHSHSW
jgi:hypothetical protein